MREFNKKMVHLTKATKESPCFDGITLDPTIYLRWIWTLKDYFEAKECSDEQSFLIATQKLQGYAYY